MAKALWQITDYLKEKGAETTFDKDSRTLFFSEDTEVGEIQTRYYYDDEMEVLSCQCIYLQSFPKEKYEILCELMNQFNARLGVGAFILLDNEDLVYEINHLIDPLSPLADSVVEKLCTIPQDAMLEHLSSFLELVKNDYTVEEIFQKFWD